MIRRTGEALPARDELANHKLTVSAGIEPLDHRFFHRQFEEDYGDPGSVG
jgi:hypothetical protein